MKRAKAYELTEKELIAVMTKFFETNGWWNLDKASYQDDNQRGKDDANDRRVIHGSGC